MSQTKSFRNDPKYHAKSLEHLLPPQTSEVTLLYSAEGRWRCGLKGGCWWGSLGMALPCPLPPHRAQHPGSSPSITHTVGLGAQE